MAVQPIPAIPLVWNRTINELLRHLPGSETLSENDINWGIDNVIRILGTLAPEKIYKNLVYMNAQSKIGAFALTYSDALVSALKSHDFGALTTLLQSASTPEYDDNKYLSKSAHLDYSKGLADEMIALNTLIDRATKQSTPPERLINSLDHHKCREDVCLFSLPPDDIASGGGRDRVLLLDRTGDPIVWVADQAGKQQSYVAWCFKLPELIVLIENQINNPYTGVPFTERVLQMVRQRYDTESSLVRRYLEFKSQRQGVST